MFSSCWELRWYQWNSRSFRIKRAASTHMVLFSTLSTNCAEIGKRSSVPKRPCWKFIRGFADAQNQRDIMTNHHQGKTRRTKIDAICPTPIIYMHCHSIKHVPTWQSHPRYLIINICRRINLSTLSHWRTKLTHCHCRRWHNPTTFKCIVIIIIVMVISIIIKKEKRIAHSSTNKPLCATYDNRLAKSGIISLERG